MKNPILLVPLVLLLIGCSLFTEAQPSNLVRVLTWNVQNLFDDRYDGHEYPEFDPRKGYTREAFWQRCQQLAEVLKNVVPGGADIVALQEVENLRTVEILRDRFLSGLGYNHIIIAHEAGETVRPVFLSRFSIIRTAAHYPVSLHGAALRPILEAEWKWGSRSLIILNNHWKSRVPDPKTTEEQRGQYALTLNHRLVELAGREDFPLVIALGDFNASLELGKELTNACMRSVEPEQGNFSQKPYPWLAISSSQAKIPLSGVVLYDLWSENKPQAPSGSYYFRGNWSKLDHVLALWTAFLRYEWSFCDFEPVALPVQLDNLGRPRLWSARDREGISDHLPLFFSIRMNKSEP